MSSRPVAKGLFTWPPAEPRLIAAECTACGQVSFPASADCPRCGGTESTEVLLPDRGSLWTFTTQDFRPPSPPYDGSFQPYALGYVELPGGILVESRLTEPDPASLAIGRQMRLTLVPYSVDSDGTEVLTFAFAPVADGQEA